MSKISALSEISTRCRLVDLPDYLVNSSKSISELFGEIDVLPVLDNFSKKQEIQIGETKDYIIFSGEGTCIFNTGNVEFCLIKNSITINILL